MAHANTFDFETVKCRNGSSAESRRAARRKPTHSASEIATTTSNKQLFAWSRRQGVLRMPRTRGMPCRSPASWRRCEVWAPCPCMPCDPMRATAGPEAAARRKALLAVYARVMGEAYEVEPNASDELPLLEVQTLLCDRRTAAATGLTTLRDTPRALRSPKQSTRRVSCSATKRCEASVTGSGPCASSRSARRAPPYTGAEAPYGRKRAVSRGGSLLAPRRSAAPVHRGHCRSAPVPAARAAAAHRDLARCRWKAVRRVHTCRRRLPQSPPR